MTGARDKLYTVVGVNIQKREMVLSPNDEKVANSCKKKKHTQFKTRVHKPTLFQTKMVETDTLFQTKTAAEKPYPLAPLIPLLSI